MDLKSTENLTVTHLKVSHCGSLILSAFSFEPTTKMAPWYVYPEGWIKK